MKKLKLELGQTIVLKRYKSTPGGKDATEHLGEWDVVKVNKKSVVLQNWPTYEQRVIRF